MFGGVKLALDPTLFNHRLNLGGAQCSLDDPAQTTTKRTLTRKACSVSVLSRPLHPQQPLCADDVSASSFYG